MQDGNVNVSGAEGPVAYVHGTRYDLIVRGIKNTKIKDEDKDMIPCLVQGYNGIVFIPRSDNPQIGDQFNAQYKEAGKDYEYGEGTDKVAGTVVYTGFHDFFLIAQSAARVKKDLLAEMAELGLTNAVQFA